MRTSSRKRTWALRTPVEQPSRKSKKCCYSQRNLGSIYGSLFPSPTHLSHITNSNPFENKVWEVYFYKEVFSLFFEVRHYVPLILFISICMVVTIQQNPYFGRDELNSCKFYRLVFDVLMKISVLRLHRKRRMVVWKSLISTLPSWLERHIWPILYRPCWCSLDVQIFSRVYVPRTEAFKIIYLFDSAAFFRFLFLFLY